MANWDRIGLTLTLTLHTASYANKDIEMMQNRLQSELERKAQIETDIDNASQSYVKLQSRASKLWQVGNLCQVEADDGSYRLARVSKVTSSGVRVTLRGESREQYYPFNSLLPLEKPIRNRTEVENGSFGIKEAIKTINNRLSSLESQLDSQIELKTIQEKRISKIKNSQRDNLNRIIGDTSNRVSELKKETENTKNMLLKFWDTQTLAQIPRSNGSTSIAKIVSRNGDQVTVEWTEPGSKQALQKTLSLSALDTPPHLIKESQTLKRIKSFSNDMEKRLSEAQSRLEAAKSAASQLQGPNIVSQEQCEAAQFDNRHLMGPDTNQRNSSLCWAHATASLLEEQLCLATQHLPKGSGNYCNTNVARSDVGARVYEKSQGLRFMADKEGGDGGFSREGLDYFISRNGNHEVCLDKYGKNPFDTDQFGYVTSLKRFFHQYQTKRCEDGRLSDAFLLKLIDTCDDIKTLLERDQQMWSFTAEEMRDANHLMTDMDLIRLAKKSKNQDDFAQKVLLFYCDGVGRRSFARPGVNLSVKSDGFKNREYSPQRDQGDFRNVPVEPYLQHVLNAKKMDIV